MVKPSVQLLVVIIALVLIINCIQESRAVARKPRDAAAVLFGLKFTDSHYKFKSSQASKATLQSSKLIGEKKN